MIGILCALDAEVSRLYELIEDAKVDELYGYRFASGRLEGRDVVVAKCGVGKVNAAVCAQTMIMKYAPEIIINSGVAGSLSPELSICDIAVGKDIVQHDVDTTACGDPVGFVSTVKTTYFPCDAGICEIICDAARSLGIHSIPARIASGDQFVSETAVKQSINERYAPACVEMEGAAVGHAAFMYEKPFLVIRTMSDAADDNADETYDNFIDEAAKTSAEIILHMLALAEQ